MQVTRLQKEIIKRGGTAEIITETIKDHNGKNWDKTTLRGILNQYDIEMSCNNGREMTGGNTYFTTRRIKNRGHFDAGSDYNPFGYEFHHKIKELDWINNT